MHALVIYDPALPPEHDLDAQVSEPRTRIGNVANAHPQWRLVSCPAAQVPGGALEQGQPARTLHAHLEVLVDPAGNLAPPCRPQTFFRSTSCRMCRSSVRSPTTRFNRAFSSSSCFNLRSSVTPRLAYLRFQM